MRGQFNKVSYICLQCEAAFERFPSERKGKFCSKRCEGLYRRKDKIINPNGYVKVRVGENNERKLEHRLVMEEVLGRALRDDEHVHHKDNDKTNNDPTNLEVLSPSEHASLHGANGRWARGYDKCTDCGRTDRRHTCRGRCMICYQRERKRAMRLQSLGIG